MAIEQLGPAPSGGNEAVRKTDIAGFQANLTVVSTKTANYSANANEAIPVDASGGNVTITLPSAPPNGTQVFVKRNEGGGNTASVACGGSDVFNISGGSTSQTMPFQNYGLYLLYASGIWYQLGVSMPIGQLDARYLTPAGAATITSKTISADDNTITWLSWCPEMVMNSAAVVDGYNDMPGGISVEPGANATGCTLDAIWVRIGDLATNNSGGDLVISIYNGTATTQGTLITTITLTNGTNKQIATLGTTYPLPANTVVRASLTKGSSTLAKPLHIQLRGRYVG